MNRTISQDWRALIAKFESVFRATVCAFEPSVRFCDKADTKLQGPVQIPKWVAERIVEFGDPNKVSFVWECPECGHTTEWAYKALALMGGPVCCECEHDMAMMDTED
jgi:hypothetical protein